MCALAPSSRQSRCVLPVFVGHIRGPISTWRKQGPADMAAKPFSFWDSLPIVTRVYPKRRGGLGKCRMSGVPMSEFGMESKTQTARACKCVRRSPCRSRDDVHGELTPPPPYPRRVLLYNIQIYTSRAFIHSGDADRARRTSTMARTSF